jgi:hypothetical protein
MYLAVIVVFVVICVMLAVESRCLMGIFFCLSMSGRTCKSCAWDFWCVLVVSSALPQPESFDAGTC